MSILHGWPSIFDRMLRAYAELTVKVGLNLQPHQRLLIIGPVANGGCSLEAAPLVRQITAAAYDAGARLVETLWGDEALLGARLRACAARFVRRVLRLAARRARADTCAGGHAVLSIYANDPGSAEGRIRRSCVAAVQQATARDVRPFREHISRNQTELGRRRRAGRGVGGARVSRHLTRRRAGGRSCGTRSSKLCRLDRPDPIAAWETHLGAARRAHRVSLNAQAVLGAALSRPRHRR